MTTFDLTTLALTTYFLTTKILDNMGLWQLRFWQLWLWQKILLQHKFWQLRPATHFTLGCKSVFCRFSFMAAQLAGEPFHHGLVWSQIMYIYDMGWKLGMVQTKQIQCLSYLRFTTTLSNIFLFRITLNLIFRQFQFQSRIIHPNMTLWKLKVSQSWIWNF